MSLRIRQIVLVAHDLTVALQHARDTLGLHVIYRDPEVANFGLENALMQIGDQFLEIVAPTRADTAASRHLDRHGNCAYMLILQTDDLTRERACIEQLGVRIVWESSQPDMRAIHLHPKISAPPSSRSIRPHLRAHGAGRVRTGSRWTMMQIGSSMRRSQRAIRPHWPSAGPTSWETAHPDRRMALASLRLKTAPSILSRCARALTASLSSACACVLACLFHSRQSSAAPDSALAPDCVYGKHHCSNSTSLNSDHALPPLIEQLQILSLVARVSIQ